MFAALTFTGVAAADGAPPSVVYAQMPAHPALWTVHGAKGTAYLFGSVHVLPSQVDWHRKEIDTAFAKADVLVFEIAMGDDFRDKVQTLIQQRGMLPEGQHLHDLLSAEEAKALDTEVAKLSLRPDQIDKMRPWLASLAIETASIAKQNYSAAAGVDVTMQEKAGTRAVIGLETLEQQIALIAPQDPKAELESFEVGLKTQSKPESEEMGPLLDAWMHGRPDQIAALTKKDMSPYPDAEKLLLDDRNDAWVKKIETLLQEPKTYFITVGAAHLAGPHGVPTLLRAQGFKVEGP